MNTKSTLVESFGINLDDQIIEKAGPKVQMAVPIWDSLLNTKRFCLVAGQKEAFQPFSPDLNPRRGQFLAESSVCVFFTRILTPPELELRARRKREHRPRRKSANHGKDIALRKGLRPDLLPVQFRECRTPAGERQPAHRASQGNSTHVVAARNVGKLLRSARLAPGRRTGITRKRLPLSWTRRSMAARISSFCQGPKPPGPTKTAQVSDSAKAFSISGCQGLPGIR
jgi:hypothetical protein